jgi:lysophospholipase L1-like esterase
MRIVAIGDSLTYGFPFGTEFSWVELVAQRTGIDMVNAGVCGETTGDMLLRFKQDALDYKPAVVIITGGSNDAFFGVSPSTVGDNIDKMVRLAAKENIISVIGVPPPVCLPEEKLLVQYRQHLRSLAVQTNIMLIDFYRNMVDDFSSGLKSDYHIDGVHPNLKGYEVMADVAEAVLRKLLSSDE